MIHKPCRVNVRFTENEYAELEEMIRMNHAWDMSNLVRRALAHFRRALYMQQEELHRTGKAPTLTDSSITAPIVPMQDAQPKPATPLIERKPKAAKAGAK